MEEQVNSNLASDEADSGNHYPTLRTCISSFVHQPGTTDNDIVPVSSGFKPVTAMSCSHFYSGQPEVGGHKTFLGSGKGWIDINTTTTPASR